MLVICVMAAVRGYYCSALIMHHIGRSTLGRSHASMLLHVSRWQSKFMVTQHHIYGRRSHYLAISPQCTAAVTAAALDWLHPSALEGVYRAVRASADSPPVASPPRAAAEATERADAASAHVGALAAVLHYLAAYGDAANLQQGSLQELSQRVAAPGLWSTASAPQNGGALTAAGPGAQWHPLIAHALECVQQRGLHIGPIYALSMPRAACVELLDGLLALQQTLGDADLGAVFPRAVSAAVDQQAGLVPILVVFQSATCQQMAAAASPCRRCSSAP